MNFFDSSEDMEKSTEALDKALSAHPEIGQMQDHLLQW